jgi:RNA polymerase sigma-70 factor, ECF subfamily
MNHPGALIDRILSGHKELFMDLVRPHQRTVYATVFALLANKQDAEDVAQDALLKALAHLNQFRKESSFGTWLIQIAINEARRRNRKQCRIPMLSLAHNKNGEKAYVPKNFEDWREIPSAVLERVEIRKALIEALTSLARHYREAFVLRDIHELSISETSAILGISPGAVKTRLRRARLMLRDILAPGLVHDGRFG